MYCVFGILNVFHIQIAYPVQCIEVALIHLSYAVGRIIRYHKSFPLNLVSVYNTIESCGLSIGFEKNKGGNLPPCV